MSTRSPVQEVEGFTPTLPSKHLPQVEIREMPEPPASMWRIIGPGIVGAGVGLASGEFILWPYISSQVGLVFLWGALVGVIVQWFLDSRRRRPPRGRPAWWPEARGKPSRASRPWWRRRMRQRRGSRRKSSWIALARDGRRL
jgi:hypothetical protein